MRRSSDPSRIAVAEPLPILRDGLCSLIEGASDFKLVGRAADGEEALRIVVAEAPDVLILELSMPRIPTLELLREMTRRVPLTRALVLSDDIHKRASIEALRAGARGILPRSSTTDILFKSIRCIAAGEYWVGREQIADVCDYLRLHKNEGRDGSGLTWREWEVVSAIQTGRTNKEIAKRFSISEQTVKHHLTNIFRKLAVSNRLELALYMVEHGLPAQSSRQRPIRRKHRALAG